MINGDKVQNQIHIITGPSLRAPNTAAQKLIQQQNRNKSSSNKGVKNATVSKRGQPQMQKLANRKRMLKIKYKRLHETINDKKWNKNIFLPKTTKERRQSKIIFLPHNTLCDDVVSIL